MRRRVLRATVVLVAVFAGAVASTQLAGRASRTTVRIAAPSTPTTTAAEDATAVDVPPTMEQPAIAPHTFAVTSTEVMLVDESRPAPDRHVASAPGPRRIRTVILRPEGVAAPTALVVFAHGYDSEPETYEPLLHEWAAAGYEVAAPELPGSAHDLPGTPQRDIADQARDLSFVTTELIERDPGAIDSTRIVAAGHSDGGSAVALLGFNSAYADSRFDTFLVLSGAIPDDVADGGWQTGVPGQRLLVTVGDEDENGNLPAAQTIYDSTTIPAALVVVPGGDHRNMYLDDTPTAESVRAMTVHFLEAATQPASSSWPAFGRNDDFVIDERSLPS